MKEEHKFNSHIMEQQLNETKVRKQIEIEEVDSRAQNIYEEKLANSLRELRDAIKNIFFNQMAMYLVLTNLI